MKEEQENSWNKELPAPISKRYTAREVARAIEKSHGITSSICALLDCSRNQLAVYFKHRPEMKTLQEEARQEIVDKAETRITELLSSQDDEIALKAAEFVLRRIGSKRGWGDTQVAQEIKTDGVSIRQIFGLKEDDE